MTDSNRTTSPPPDRSRLTHILHQLAWRIEAAGERLESFVSKSERASAKVRIVAYAGYRTASEVFLRARALQHHPTIKARNNISRFQAMMRLYNSHELPGVTLRLTYEGKNHEAITDGEGYAVFRIACDRPLPAHTIWEEAMIDAPGRDVPEAPVKVPILAPGSDMRWGVISDIDDTVLETGATNFLKNWRRVLIHNAEDRIPVPGAPDLYAHIATDHEKPTRPFFYVSSSPYNLYPLIADFMVHNHIPLGPMFLKDYGIDRHKFIKTGHGEHKIAAVETILAAYPDMIFLLVGDSGQHDIHIYHELATRHPDRFGACIIRDVEGRCGEPEKAAVLEQIRALGIPTYCKASLEQATELLATLGIDEPAEAAKAVATEQESEKEQLKSA